MVTPFKKKKNNPFLQSTQPAITANAPMTKAPQAPANKDVALKKPNEIRFNADRSVDYTVGGQTTRLSQEEYKRLGETSIKGFSEKGGTPTQKEKNVAQDLARKRQVMEIDKQLKGEATRNEIVTNLLTDEANKNIALPSVEELQATEKVKSSQALGEGLAPDIAQSLGLPRQKGIGEAIGMAKSTTAGIVDFIRVGITGKKPLKVQQAEATFNDLNSALGQDVKLVQAGALSLEEAKVNLEKAAQTINRMEESQKKLGKENLRYWTDNGAEVQAQIIIQKEQLAGRRLELLNAAQQAALVNSRLNYGNSNG